MCTAITYKKADHYFGRNMDLEYSYNEEVTITPRNFPLKFRAAQAINKHYSFIGMATISDGYPLYYDATNEMGLSVAALNFPDNAYYPKPSKYKINIAPFELIPFLLSQCATVEDAIKQIQQIQIASIPFSHEFPITPLHWIVADTECAITIEPMRTGLMIHENPVGILTNNPPFDFHMHNLNRYLNLTREEPKNSFAPGYPLLPHSRGLGAIGLPGDLSSSSRFIRAAFTKLNSVCTDCEEDIIGQFFHILTSVEQQSGCVRIGNAFEKTIYSSCCNAAQGIYYYTTYNNRQITALNMKQFDLNSERLFRHQIIHSQNILHVNSVLTTND